MAISYPLSLPGTNIAGITVRAVHAAVASRNPFTFSTTVQRWSGQAWFIDVQLNLLDAIQARPWTAFLNCLKGNSGTFLANDPGMKTPSGIATGTPRVKGASQTGESLITDGWTPSQTGILKAGDYFSIDNHLHQVLTNANSDINGETTLDIFPRIRGTLADDTLLVVSDPKGLFRLLDNAVQWDVREEKYYNIAFSAVEAFV